MTAIDTGDSVLHGPTGEMWTVAYVRGDYLAWIGWPEGEARVDDCTLVRKATAEERRTWLERLAAIRPDNGRLDMRARHAQHILATEAADDR